MVGCWDVLRLTWQVWDKCRVPMGMGQPTRGLRAFSWRNGSVWGWSITSCKIKNTWINIWLENKCQMSNVKCQMSNSKYNIYNIKFQNSKFKIIHCQPLDCKILFVLGKGFSQKFSRDSMMKQKWFYGAAIEIEIGNWNYT